MKEFERIEKRFKQLKDFLLERQAEDQDADRDDEGDGYNIARVDLHEIKLAFFALAQERDRLRAERDEARREVCAFASGRYRKDVVTLDRTAAIAEAELRGWYCFEEVKK